MLWDQARETREESQSNRRDGRPVGEREQTVDERLKIWEIPFQRALILIDEARAAGLPVEEWTSGGCTVLMQRHRHRLSSDVDIFINDPQFIGYLTPDDPKFNCLRSLATLRLFSSCARDRLAPPQDSRRSLSLTQCVCTP